MLSRGWRWAGVVGLMSIGLAACAPAPLAEPPPAPVVDNLHDEVAQQIEAELTAINPAALPVFQAASEALYVNNDLTTAQTGYEQVLVLVPEYSHALRRLSLIRLYVEDVPAALDYAQRAVAADPSGYNHQALARALLATELIADKAKALDEARQAAEALPDDDGAILTWVMATTANGLATEGQQAAEHLLAVAPWSPIAHYLTGLFAADAGEWERAELELQLAQQMGMPADAVQHTLFASGVAFQARLYRWLRRGGYLMVTWVLGFGVLFGVGSGLSRATLAAVNRPAMPGQPQISLAERVLRFSYRTVINLSALYFYISLPLLGLFIVTVGVVVGYTFLALEHVPLTLLFGLFVGGVYTLTAIGRSLFVRVDDGEPGRRLQRTDAPELWALTETIATRLKTRPVEAIYITPGVEVAVTERGGQLAKLRGRAERALIVGLGALPGLTRGQLRSILAHEYGHFSNRDTAGGELARRVRVSTFELAVGLARSRQAHWYNPAWWFANGFQRLFLRISLGASRLQEILADRYAVMAYGVRDFSDGLRHIARQALVFEAALTQETEMASTQQRSLSNLYTLPQMPALYTASTINQRFTEVLGRPTSTYDSHPALQDRLRLVNQAGAPMQVAEDSRPAWEMLRNADTLQEAMTGVVQSRLQNWPLIPRVRN